MRTRINFEVSPSGRLGLERVVRIAVRRGGIDADRCAWRDDAHWTAAMMAGASKISASAVRRIWKAHGLQPRRYRRFKLSNDKAFADKLHDVVGLHVGPPAHAIMLSFDEKSRIEALDRMQPGLLVLEVGGADEERLARHNDA